MIELLHGDCLERLPELPDCSVDAIVTDPPYFRVKGEAWDRQWDDADQFIAWIGQLCEQWHRVLKPNGSLYVWASPKMAARVEVEISQRFNVLNRIRWVKAAGWHQKAEKEALRSYLSPWEECIFAEHYGADNIAKGEAGYAAKCDELRGFLFESLRSYIAGEFERAGMLNQAGKIAANVACGFSPSPGGMASRHYFSQSQWQLPTEAHYLAMRELLNKSGGDYLRREYEDLRREYEDLRRPFSVSAAVPYTDVWNFSTVKSYPGKHPCEKPVDMLRHIITASTKPGAVVLDCFMGSGSTGEACKLEGRQFIGIERDPAYLESARKRLNTTAAHQEDLFA
jgi:site-specific DNA-methyltransferase (adenine-specific)